MQTIADRATVWGLIQCAYAARVPLSPQLRELANFHGIDPEEVCQQVQTRKQSRYGVDPTAKL